MCKICRRCCFLQTKHSQRLQDTRRESDVANASVTNAEKARGTRGYCSGRHSRSPGRQPPLPPPIGAIEPPRRCASGGTNRRVGTSFGSRDLGPRSPLVPEPSHNLRKNVRLGEHRPLPPSHRSTTRQEFVASSAVATWPLSPPAQSLAYRRGPSSIRRSPAAE